MKNLFDVIVVGGGHAGAEAAWAAARLGARVALVTMHRGAIARMSCNPAIGGVGKGQMVREIDALGGLMGLAIDRAGIQFRLLNRSKGPAVQSPRAQADRDGYPGAVQALLARASNIEIVEGSVEGINTKPDGDARAGLRVSGVTLADGRTLHADAVILTTGTFLRGLMHCGHEQRAGGRVGEAPAIGISAVLKGLGFELGRLKTGTPPRVHRDSVDYDRCEPQPGDENPAPFSFMTDRITQPQIQCWVTYTNERTHGFIRDNLHRAPMYSGQIASRGPRYCPSIEDKVVRFADKPRHLIFLEPEGRDDERVYCNGISTSLPKDVQDDFVRTVPGLERARIVQYGYAVEYDWVPTHQTKVTLETKLVSGLFLAGQINGTSGYEEAAGQGLIAGVNAAQRVAGADPLVLRRDQAYIGVMLDDLVTRPPSEPYRMFTSRAEYRLLLRSDNADVRLTPIGRSIGLVDDPRWNRFRQKMEALATIRSAIEGRSIDGVKTSRWIRRPETTESQLASFLQGRGLEPIAPEHLRQVLIDAKYEGYLQRQATQVKRFRRMESLRIPGDLNYGDMGDLRIEAREALTRIRPLTLGQASRISSLSPADVTVLWIRISRKRGHRTSSEPPRFTHQTS